MSSQEAPRGRPTSAEPSSSAPAKPKRKPPPLKIQPPKEVHVKSTSLDIRFEDLTRTARVGLFRRRTKTILDNVSGEFRSGELTAIMGPSGAGKSTLMNVLTGYITNWTGSVKINGRDRDISRFRRQSCYIMQDDHLQPLLSVEESMNVAANLKLNADVSKLEKIRRVNEILRAIGLEGVVRKTKVGNLSGGQKKRLAIALELVSNPPVMFFDEPTSGLDSSSSKQCIILLKKLAREGRTVVCTIHQPSASLLEMFDHLYTIADGKCVYQGCIKGLVPYLGELELICPNYHNPSDYLLELTDGDNDGHITKLVNKSENGKNNDWRKSQSISLQLDNSNQSCEMIARGLMTPVDAPKLPITPFSPPWAIPEEAIKKKFELDPMKCCKSQNRYPTPFCRQLSVLLLRNLRMLTRDRTLTYMRFFIHMSIAILLGILYFQIGMEAQFMRDNFNFVFFTVMFLMFTAFNSMTLSFPLELPIIKREHFNQWYSLKAYYVAMTLSDIPIQLLSTMVYAIVTFLLTGQPLEMFRLVYFTTVCVLISFIAQGLGIMNGAIFNIQNGVIIGPFFMMPFVMFSGFFVTVNDAHPALQWLFHISYLKYGFEAAMLSIYGYDRTKLECLSQYCHYRYPSKFLAEVSMQYANYGYSVMILFSVCIIVRISTYFVLHFRLKNQQ